MDCDQAARARHFSGKHKLSIIEVFMSLKLKTLVFKYFFMVLRARHFLAARLLCHQERNAYGIHLTARLFAISVGALKGVPEFEAAPVRCCGMTPVWAAPQSGARWAGSNSLKGV